MVRIFTACHGTQLLVIQHLRRHLQLPQAKEFLLWDPMENIPFIDNFMRSIISTAGFADTLDIRDFESLRPRTHGPLTWWFESSRRLQRDAATLRYWMKRNGIAADDVELWADEPIHFNVNISRGFFRESCHIKIPHCFNFEDEFSLDWKGRIEGQWQDLSWPKQFLFLPWQRLTTGVDLRMRRVMYSRAYTFDQPSTWSQNSVDVSSLISIESFDHTYRTFPAHLRADVEAILGPIRVSRRPLVLLLLFGLGTGPESRHLYEKSVSRIFLERAAELKGCSLAIKVHPGAWGAQEKNFIDWAKAHVPADVFPIVHALNLEFMLPQLRPDFVLAGPCGALPIVRRLGVARPVVLSEIMDAELQRNPSKREGAFKLVDGMEIW